MKYLKTLTLITCLLLTAYGLLFLGCGGKKRGAASLSDEAKIESLIAQTSILEGIVEAQEDDDDMTAKVQALLKAAVIGTDYSVARSRLSIKREIKNITVSGDAAAVECIFTLSGELKFVDKTTGKVADKKTINMTTAGSYTLRRDIAGNWYITSYPEYSLEFKQGEANAPTIKELTLSKVENISPKESINVTAKITGAVTGSEFYAVFRINKLGVKRILEKQADGSYKTTITIPPNAAEAYYVALLDVIDTTISCSLATEYKNIYAAALKTTKVTIGQPPGVAQPEVDAAEEILFKPDDDDGDKKKELTDAEFNQAYNYLNSALSKDPTHPDANLLIAIVKTIKHIDDIMVRYGTEGTEEGVFPFKEEIGKILPKAAPAVHKLLTTARNNISVSAISKLPQDAARKGRIEGNIAHVEKELPTTLNILAEIIRHLTQVEGYIINHPQYTYQIPKDLFDPSEGAYYIDRGDIYLLLAGFYALKGWLNFAAAYHIDDKGFFDKEGWRNNDKNNDKWLQPAEYLPPPPFATLKPDGATRLRTAHQALIDFAKYLQKGVDETLAEKPPTVLEVLTSQQIQDINNNKKYIKDFKTSMEGTPVTVTAEPDWDVTWTSTRVKLSGLFDPPIVDWRRILPDMDLNMEYAKTDAQGNIIYPDPTLNGILPDRNIDKVLEEKSSLYITGYPMVIDACDNSVIKNAKVKIEAQNITANIITAAYNRQHVEISTVIHHPLKKLEMKIVAPGYRDSAPIEINDEYIYIYPPVKLTPTGGCPPADAFPVGMNYEWKYQEDWTEIEKRYDAAGNLIYSTAGSGTDYFFYKVASTGDTICGYSNVITMRECKCKDVTCADVTCDWDTYYHKTATEVRIIGRKHLDTGRVTCYPEPMLVLKQPLQVGNTWTKVIPDDIIYDVKVLTKESVLTPGYSGDAYKIEYKMRPAGGKTETIYYWYADRVGRVKNETSSIYEYTSGGIKYVGSSESTIKLLSYKFPSAKLKAASAILPVIVLHHLHNKIHNKKLKEMAKKR